MKPSRISGVEIALTVLLFFVLTLTTLVHASPTQKITRDNGVYLYVGQIITENKLPYRDAWESKPPAIFYADALGLALGGGTRWGTWGLEFICLLSAVLISYFTLKELWGRIPALGGTLLWLLAMDVLLAFDGGNFTEEYPLPLHFLSIYLLIKLLEKPERHFLYYAALGLNFGGAFLFRPNNAAVELIAIGILTLANLRQRAVFARLGFIAAGALAPLLLTAAYFARFGLFSELLDATLLYNFTYGSTQIGTQTPFERIYALLGWVAWLATLGYAFAVLRFYKALKSGGAEFYLQLFLVLGAPACVFLSDLAQRGYEHYFINSLPMIGLLGALLFRALTEIKHWEPGEKTYAVILTLFMIAASVFFVASGRKDRYFLITDFSTKNFWSKNQRVTPISKYARLHSQSDETVLFWSGMTGENFLAARGTPSSVMAYPVLLPSKVSDRLNVRFLEELKANPPVIIIDLLDPFIPSIDPAKRALQGENLNWNQWPDNLDETFAYIHENYVLKEVVAGKDIYYRIGTK